MTRPLTIGLVLTVIVVALDGLAVTTAMPVAAADLGGLDAYGWTFSAFMLANIVGIVATGRSADRHGPLPAFVAGAGAFGLGLALGAVAPSMVTLIAARAVQGLGAGALSTIVYACIGSAYPADQQPRMLAIISSAWVVPGLVGPAIGGAVADQFGWRFVFAGMVPFVVAAMVLVVPAVRALRPSSDPPPERSRMMVAAMALAVGVVGLLLALESESVERAVALGVSGVLLAAPGAHRLFPAGTITLRRGLPGAVGAMGLVCFAFFGAETLVPLVVTVVRGERAVAGGLALTGAALSWTAGAWVQARRVKTGQRSRLVMVGALVIALGILGVLPVVDPTTPIAALWAAWTVTGFGMGLAHATISLVVLEQADSGQEGSASAAMQLASSLGVAFGAGLAGWIVGHGGVQAERFSSAIVVMVVAALVVGVAARRLPSDSSNFTHE